jgi:predicted ribosomally synthesized peptide with SipW-like signal peptide
MRKILLSLVIIVGVSAFAIGATKAYFTDVKKGDQNEFATGTVKIGQPNNLPIILTNMSPGKSYNRYVELNYIGSLNADMWVGVGGITAPGDKKYLADHLLLTVKDGSNNLIWEGWTKDLSSSWLQIASDISAGYRGYNLTFKLDANTPNEHQGADNTDTVFYFYAVETGGLNPNSISMPYLFESFLTTYQAP